MKIPARRAQLPPALPQWDPRWSRLVTVPTVDGERTFHVLDTLPVLQAAGVEPTGTIVALHGNPTWSYLWRHLAAEAVKRAADPGCGQGGDSAEAPDPAADPDRGQTAGRGQPKQVWRVIAPDQLEMGYSERLAHNGLPTKLGPGYRRIPERLADFDALVSTLLAETTAAEATAGSPQATAGLTEPAAGSAEPARGDAAGPAHPVVTIGHDWGGVLSLTWAARNQERVDAVISLNTAVQQPANKPLPIPLQAALAGPMLPTSTVLTDWFVRVTLNLPDLQLTPDVKKAFAAPYDYVHKRAGVGAFVADIPTPETHPSYNELQQLAQDIPTIRKPALLLWGPKDPVFVEMYFRDLLQRLPQADSHRFEQAGHLVSEQAPVAATVLDWLATTFPNQATTSAPTPTNSPTPAPPSPPLIFEQLAARGADTSPLDASGADTHAVCDSIATVDMNQHPARQISWRQLAHVVDAIATGLHHRGVRPGDRVSLLIPPGSNLTAALYACVKIGAVAVVADAGLGPAGMTRAVKSARPQWIIGEVPGLSLARAMRWPGRRISVTTLSRLLASTLNVETSLTELSRTTPALPPPPQPEDDAAVLFTSGSTGPAKGVRYTHARLAALAAVLRREFSITPGAGLVAGFPPFALLGPAIGATSVTPDMSVTKPRTLTAAALADAVSAGSATMVFASPAAFSNVVATAGQLNEQQRRALAQVTTVLSAGAPVPLQLMDQLAEVFPAASIHSPYGMTEGLLLTNIDRAGLHAAQASGQHGVCVGRPIAGVELALAPLDAAGEASEELLTGAAAHGVLGEFVVSAAHIRAGYDQLWRTQVTASRDQLGYHTLGPGYSHRTNDIGQIDEQGRVWLAGRLQHVVTTPAGPLGPGGLEAAVDSLPDVARSAVVGVGPVGTQAVVVILDAEHADYSAGLAPAELARQVRHCGQDLGVDVAAVLAAPRFPTDIRHNSKIDRTRLAAWADSVLQGGAPSAHGLRGGFVQVTGS